MANKSTIDGLDRETLAFALGFKCHGYKNRTDQQADKQNALDKIRTLLDAPECDHDFTDDGEFLLICTKCGIQERHDPKWRGMESAPKDGTMIRLLVSFDEHSTEDEDEAPTIGANNFDNDGEDIWRFAGWCWSHDHFTQGIGSPVGWLPMLDSN